MLHFFLCQLLNAQLVPELSLDEGMSKNVDSTAYVARFFKGLESDLVLLLRIYEVSLSAKEQINQYRACYHLNRKHYH
jgi:hypothetical protein